MPYVIQGKSTDLPTEPFLKGDKHYVSLREVVEAMGGSVSFDNATKTSTATIAPWTATIRADNPAVTMTGNGQTVPITLTSAPYIENDELFVPFDFIRDAFGYTVSFDNDTVTITNPNA